MCLSGHGNVEGDPVALLTSAFGLVDVASLAFCAGRVSLLVQVGTVCVAWVR